MNEQEFMQKTGIFCFNGIYHFVYREKNIIEYITELESGKNPLVDKECVKHFGEQIENITDGFEVNINLVGTMYNTKEPIYSVSIIDANGFKFNQLFANEFLNDKNIELLINSLCEVLHSKGHRKFSVRFLIIWNKEEFKQYFDDYMKEVN